MQDHVVIVPSFFWEDDIDPADIIGRCPLSSFFLRGVEWRNHPPGTYIGHRRVSLSTIEPMWLNKQSWYRPGVPYANQNSSKRLPIISDADF